MGFRRGENVVVTIGAEDTFNAGQTTPAGYVVPLASVDGGRSREWDANPVLRGDPYQGDPLYGMKRTNLTLRVPVTLETVPIIMKEMGGIASATATTAPYTHTIIGYNTTAPGSLWVERWFSDVTKGDLFKGCKAGGCRISVSGKQPQPLFMEIPIVGTGNDSRATTAQYDTAADTTMTGSTVHVLKDLVLKLDTTEITATVVDGFDMTIGFAQNPFDHLDGNDYAAAVEPGWYEVTGSVTGLWDDGDTLRALEQESTATQVQLYSYLPGSTTQYVIFEAGRAFFNVETDFAVSGPGPVKGTINFRGAYASGDTSSWKITVVNGTSSYGAIL